MDITTLEEDYDAGVLQRSGLPLGPKAGSAKHRGERLDSDEKLALHGKVNDKRESAPKGQLVLERQERQRQRSAQKCISIDMPCTY